MKYKLFAADMDGTALNSKKELTPRTVAAMEKAIEQGKTVVFSTGRSISFVKPYINMVRGMRYAVTASGASVIDLETGEKLLYETIDAETAKYVIAAAAGCGVMPIIFVKDKAYSSAWCVENCADFAVGSFKPVYNIGMTLVDDVFAHFMENPERAEKINLFFDNDYEADMVYDRIKDLPVKFTTRTSHSLEINASGVSKAKGLKALCKRLGIDISECMAIGDAENDEELLSAAGFKLSMANGSDKVKSISDVTVPDCDSEGVAAAIEQYFLD